MTFEEMLDHAIAMLQRRGRLTYGTLKRQFQLDDDALTDLKDALLYAHPEVCDDAGRGLVWTGYPQTALPATAPAGPRAQPPLAYTPKHLAEKILTSKAALEGERKQVTVLFADLKGSMELLADRDPEEARALLDPVLERLMAAVHRYEGTVNQVMGDGIMALFGDAMPLLTQAVERSAAMARVDEAARCRLSLGEAQMLAGRLEEAHALAEGTLAHTRAHQERGNEAYALRLLGDIAARREPRELDQAESYYRQALALAKDLGMRPLQAHCHLGLGTVYAKTDQREQAHAELSAAIELYRALEMTFWLPEAEAALAEVEGH
jgi:tetratricopeptide (TPR) repeat protein